MYSRLESIDFINGAEQQHELQSLNDLKADEVNIRPPLRHPLFLNTASLYRCACQWSKRPSTCFSLKLVALVQEIIYGSEDGIGGQAGLTVAEV